MKNRIDMGKPLNLNDQLNAINKGLLPTPQASDAEHGGPNARDKNGRLHLSAIAARFPTPRASSGNGAGRHGKGGMDLQTAVMLWATPTANDAKNSLTNSQAGRGTLTAHVVETGEVQGRLNPEFVEWLMGYPLGYTDINQEEAEHGKTSDRGREEGVCFLRENFGEETDEREAGRPGRIPEEAILQSKVLGQCFPEGNANRFSPAKKSCEIPPEKLRDVRGYRESANTPFGREQAEYGSGKFENSLYFLSYKMALAARKENSEEIKIWLNSFIETKSPWHSEYPHIPRVVSGIKNRVSRLKCLGNAVVPQIPAFLWRLIAEALWD